MKSLLIIACVVLSGCATVVPEGKYPNLQCRYEATVATTNMGCTGLSCMDRNIDKIIAWDNIYNQCDRLKPINQFSRQEY